MFHILCVSSQILSETKEVFQEFPALRLCHKTCICMYGCGLSKQRFIWQKMTDPWMVRGAADANKVNLPEIDSEKSVNTIVERFEDDFSPQVGDLQDSGAETKSLPDSQQYLAALERKLNRIKRDPNLIEQLSRKREECLRNLLNNSLNLNSEDDLALDAPVTSGDSAVQEIYRHIQPVQPLNIGETLHIVKYDHLEERNPPEEASPESASR